MVKSPRSSLYILNIWRISLRLHVVFQLIYLLYCSESTMWCVHCSGWCSFFVWVCVWVYIWTDLPIRSCPHTMEFEVLNDAKISIWNIMQQELMINRSKDKKPMLEIIWWFLGSKTVNIFLKKMSICGNWRGMHNIYTPLWISHKSIVKVLVCCQLPCI